MANLLIIDDSAIHRAEILRALESEGEETFTRVLEAADGYEGLKLLLNEEVDVVLCDLEMPGLDGEKLLQVKRTRLEDRNIPFLFLTASTDIDRKVKLLQSGAVDEITKPFHPADLVARLKLHLKIKLLQDELREKNEMLSELSTTDSLTGLRTRRYVTEALTVETLRASRYDAPLALMMADLDHFKSINDTYGHAGGDLVLKGSCEILTRNLRGTDVAGRWGGEEFIVILPETDLDGAIKLAERWREEIEEFHFESAEGKRIQVTTSIGVAAFGEKYEKPEDLVNAADEALYKAKEAGRNQVVANRD